LLPGFKSIRLAYSHTSAHSRYSSDFDTIGKVQAGWLFIIVLVLMMASSGSEDDFKDQRGVMFTVGFNQLEGLFFAQQPAQSPESPP
jgi:hypothetical protein